VILVDDVRMPTRRRRIATTLPELLIVLAVVAIALGALLVASRRGGIQRDAAALARAVTSARWLAVSMGVPSALVMHDGAVHLVSSAPPRCDLTPSGEPHWVPSRPLSLHWPAAGLVFGAHGRPLRCDGSAVGNATITLSARDGSRAAVIVASLGRVRWEPR